MIIPVTALALFSALTGPSLTTSVYADNWNIAQALPRSFFWTWANVLVFSINNQSTNTDAVLEDSINKPWRPIPAGRISMIQARRLLLGFVPAVYLLSVLWLGAAEETLMCYGLTWLYNDLGGANEHFLLRNLLNGAAYLVYGSGALRVILGSSATPSGAAYTWLFLVASVIFTTMQVQDLKDQEGDKARKRHTAPLVVGERITRWTVCIGVLVWSGIGPLYWSLRLYGYLLPLSLGLFVAVRVLCFKSCKADQRTYVIWSLWMMTFFLLPLLKKSSHFADP